MCVIYVVGRDQHLRTQVESIFPLLGYQIRLVENGADAWINLVSGQRFSCVISELHVSLMNGLHLLQNIRQYGGPIRNIAFALISNQTIFDNYSLADICVEAQATFFHKGSLIGVRETLAPFVSNCEGWR